MYKKTIECGYGLSSSYDEGIEINRKLTGQLRDKIYQHELKHRNNHYDRKDFKNDFQSKNSYFFESLKFAFKNPECLIGFMPFMWSYYFNIMTFNWSALIPFIYFGGIFILFWWLIFHINLLYASICYVLVIILLNIILLVITHKIVKNSEYKY